MRAVIAPAFIVGLGFLQGCPADPLAAAKHHVAGGALKPAGIEALKVAERDPANLEAWGLAVDIECRKRQDVSRCLYVLDSEKERLGAVAEHRDALAMALELRARGRLEQGLVAAALGDLERAAVANPKRPGVQLAIARAFAMQGRRGRAAEALERARVLSPKHPELQEVSALLPDSSEPGFGGL